jgi:hypothetical protein
MGAEACNIFFNNTVNMANHKFDNRVGHKQHKNSWMAFYFPGFNMQLYDFKRVNKMAQIKLLWILADMLGISSVILGIVDNFDSIRSVILFIVALSYLLCRLYFTVIKNSQAVREKELELWHLEQNKNEREEKINKPT